MRLTIRHTTTHAYERPVSFSDHSLFLRPLDSHRRRVESFSVQTEPACTQRWVRDAYGNILLKCGFGLGESLKLEFKTSIQVDIDEDNPFDFILESYAMAYPFQYREPDLSALKPYMSSQPARGALKVLDWFYSAVLNPMQHTDVVQFLADINNAIRSDIRYVRRDEEGIQDPDMTLRLKSGSCRDMAVLFIHVTRQLGFAARFVSGYLFDPPIKDGENTGEHVYNRAVGSMHAWAEVYLPGAGWKGFDPTNGILANGYFIPTAVSHEPSAVDPIQGKYFSREPVSSTMAIDLIIEELKDD